MKVSVCCKLDDAGVGDFIRPLADMKQIDRILLFRDKPASPHKKIVYYTPALKGSALLRQVSKFFRMLSVVPPDTAASIGIYEIPHGLLSFLIGRIKKIPVVVCIIGNPAYKKIRKGLRKRLTYFMLKRSDAVTVTGTYSRSILAQNGVNPKKIFILPNPVDMDRFSPHRTQKRYDVISLGFLNPEKELVNFLRIVRLLKSRFPNIRAAIGGKGPQRSRLEREIRELSLEANTELLGYVDNLVDYYRSGRVFVLTSSTEGLPRTVIEAMACGIPPVVSRVGDIEDLVKDGENGFVVGDYSDLNGFSERIGLLLSDEKMYNEFSARAVEFAKMHYSPQAAGRVWEQILSSLGRS